MDVLGTWKISSALKYDEEKDGPVWKPAEDILSDPECDPSDAKELSVKYIFCDDGFIRMGMEFPPDMPEDEKAEIDELVAAGEMQLLDGLLIIDTAAWKEEDGRLMFNTGIKGETLGEPVNPWAEIKVLCDELELLAYRLKKA